MKSAKFIIVAGICLGGTLPTASGGPARFWITASKDEPFPSGTMPPTIQAPMGEERTLYIWGRPATNDNGTFKTLQNFSLNLVVPTARLLNKTSAPVDPIVDFLDPKIAVHNPDLGTGRKRFQFTYDSTHGPPKDTGTLTSNASPAQVLASDCTPPDAGACTPDGIGTVYNVTSGEYSGGGDIQGLSFPVPIKDITGEDITGVGIAPGECAAFEFCPVSDTSPAAWLIAEVGFKTVRPTGINPYFLQIGESGMNHLNETSNETYVVFGRSENSPEYHASVFADPTHLQKTLAAETPHVWIEALPELPRQLGDYDNSGTVGPDDYINWRSMFGQVTAHGTGPDGSDNGDIDAADYVVWRNNLPPPVPGDYDHSGVVGPEDYDFWRTTFGGAVIPGTSADGSRNGVTDAADYVLWRKHIGNGLGSENMPANSLASAGPSSVPEPNTGTTLAVLLLLVLPSRASWGKPLDASTRHRWWIW